MLKHVTRLKRPSPCYNARERKLLSKTCCRGGEQLAAQCLIKLARDLNLKPPAPETNTLPLDQLASHLTSYQVKLQLHNKLECDIATDTVDFATLSNFH